jgi:ABC-type uncharacterized transport system permease subunit
VVKFADPTTVLDPSLDGIAACNVQHFCSALPANYAGIAALSLGSVSMTPVTDYTKAAGDVSGRKVTVAAKSGVAVVTTGTATHLVLARTTDSTMRFATTITPAPVTAAGTVDIPAWKDEISVP